MRLAMTGEERWERTKETRSGYTWVARRERPADHEHETLIQYTTIEYRQRHFWPRGRCAIRHTHRRCRGANEVRLEESGAQTDAGKNFGFSHHLRPMHDIFTEEPLDADSIQ